MGRCALHTTRSLAVSHMRHQRRVANMLNMPKSASDMGCVMPTVKQSSKARETAESTRVTTARHKSRLPRMPLPPEHNNVHHVIHEFTLYYTTAGLWSRSRRLGLETYQRLVSVSYREKLSTSRARLGLGHLRFVPKTNFRPNCTGHSSQCERALDVVSLRCSYYCSSY